MKEPNYSLAITNAWHNVFRHKILWGFGMLALLAGQFGLGDFVGRMWLFSDKLKQGVALSTILKSYLVVSLPLNHPFYLICLIVVILAFFVGLTLIAISAEGALVAAAIDGYKDKHEKSFGKYWHVGVKHFWSLLFLNLIAKILFAILLMIWFLSWQFFYGLKPAVAILLMTLSLAMILFLGMIISVLLVYGICYVIMDNLKVRVALKKATELFKKHVLVSIELSVVLFALGILFISAVVFAWFIFYFPSVIFSVLAGFLNSFILMVIGFFVSTILAVAFLIIVSGFFNAFTVNAWVYVFMKMHHEGLLSRLAVYFKKVLKR